MKKEFLFLKKIFYKNYNKPFLLEYLLYKLNFKLI